MNDVTKETIRRYVDKGIAPGGFIQSVICNDLRGAFVRADSENILHIQEIVEYVFQECPQECVGSHSKMKSWMQRGGLNGK